MKFSIISFVLFGYFFFLVNTTSAATFVVTNTNDSGTGSLREAVVNANSTTEKDEIVFDSTIFGAAQTITLTGGEIVITQPLKILGPGANLLRVSGNMNSRIFFLRNTAIVDISNLTIINGKAPVFGQTGFGNYAGGIYIEKGQLYLSQVTVTDCRAEQAGGIYNQEGTLYLVNSVISNNQAIGGRNDGSYGGGLNNYGTLVIANSSIIGNIAKGGDTSTGGSGGGVGGGIYVYAGNVTITNTTIANNSAIGGNAPNSFGGNASAAGILFGAFTDGNTSGVISNSIINNNSAVAGSGDIPSRAGRTGGGGIINAKPLQIINVTISNNSVSSTNLSSSSGGGGLSNSCSDCLTVTNSTIVGNSANSLSGGGIFVFSSFKLRNTIVANNSAAVGPDIANNVISLGNNLVGNGATTSLVNGVNNDRVGTNSAPLDPMLAPLSDNGGSTLTYLPIAGSPAINNGNNCVLQNTSSGGCLSNPLLTDQRGFVRLNPPGGIIDIGAVESGSTTFVPNAPDIPDLQSGSDTGISNDDNLTNSLAPTFDVSGVPANATVELLRNGIVVASTYSVNGGIVSVTDAPSANGTFNYTSRIIAAGATSQMSAPLSIIFDTVRPTATINQAAGQSDPTDVQPIIFLAEFDKPVYGFTANAISFNGSTANVSAANISISPFDTQGKRYLVTVSNIISTGQVRVSVIAGGASDAAGNLNASSISVDNTVNFNLLIEVLVKGRIISNSGVIKSIAFVTLTDNQTGEVFKTITNPFGYFRFKQVSTYQQTGKTFTLNVRHKNFSISGQELFINSDRDDINLNIP